MSGLVKLRRSDRLDREGLVWAVRVDRRWGLLLTFCIGISFR
jgi:hypothetical protein